MKRTCMRNVWKTCCLRFLLSGGSRPGNKCVFSILGPSIFPTSYRMSNQYPPIHSVLVWSVAGPDFPFAHSPCLQRQGPFSSLSSSPQFVPVSGLKMGHQRSQRPVLSPPFQHRMAPQAGATIVPTITLHLYAILSARQPSIVSAAKT